MGDEEERERGDSSEEGEGIVCALILFEGFDLSTFFAQKWLRQEKGDLLFASKCIIFALQKRRCYPSG